MNWLGVLFYGNYSSVSTRLFVEIDDIRFGNVRFIVTTK